MAAITWTGAVNVSVVSGVITKTSGGYSVYNAGVVSTEALAGDGKFKLTVDAANPCHFGLDPSSSLELAAKDTAWLFDCVGDGTVEIREGNGTDAVWKTDFPISFPTELEFDRTETTIRLYANGVLKWTSAQSSTGAIYAHVALAHVGSSMSNGTVVGSSNTAPVVNAGADAALSIAQATLTLNGSATDDDLPSGILTYAWSKVSGPGTVSFVDATIPAAVATFSAVGTYVLRLTVSDGALTGTDDVTITVTAATGKPVAPLTYALTPSAAIFTKPTVPTLGIAGTTIIDPTFGAPITRLSDINTAGGRSVATADGTYTNSWASDDSAFFGNIEGGGFQMYDFNPTTGVATPAEVVTGNGLTFSRDIARPHILYGAQSSNDLKVKSYNRLTAAWTVLYDLLTDAPALVGRPETYQGACYTSEDTPEQISIIYGDIQDTHNYITILNADNPALRVTIKTDTAQIKINGAASWSPLIRYDGSNSTMNALLHSSAMDKTGKWVAIHYAGAYGGARKGCNFNMVTKRAHEYDDDKWFGHAAWGRETETHSAGGTVIGYNWQFTDLTQGGVFPVGRYLIIPGPSPGFWTHDDHTSWNNCRQDGALTPIIVGTMRNQAGSAGGDEAPPTPTNDADWAELWDVIAAVATEPGTVKGVNQFWTACHHRVGQVKAGVFVGLIFRDAPRPQVSHDGMWVLFTSNWEFTLGTYGTGPSNHRRDLFLVHMAPSATGTPPTVSLTSPTEGASSSVPGTFVLTATAAADGGASISRVRFYAGTTLIATVTSAPYTYTWTNAGPGSYAVTAVAQDDNGLTTTSNTRNVTVTAIPVVSSNQTVGVHGQELSGAPEAPTAVTLGSVRDFVVPVKDVQGLYVNLTAASSIQFVFRKPNGTIIIRTGARQTSYGGADADIIAGQASSAVAHYVSETTDLDIRGLWRSQCKIVIGGETYYTEPTSFEVT